MKAIALALTLGCTSGATDRGAARNPSGAVKTTAAAATGATACAGVQTCTSTDAHAKHQAQGFDCVACHPCGGKFGFQAGFTFAEGTAIQATDAYTPGTNGAPGTCTVACHYPMGSPPHPVGWNDAATAPLACVSCHVVSTLLARFPSHPQVSPTATRTDCQVCHIVAAQHTSGTVVLQGHPVSWMTQSDPGFHAFSADRGLTACQSCHLQDLSGGKTGVACANCHAAGKIASDFTTCTGCHGGKDNTTGAPPYAIWGYGGDATRGGGTGDPIRVGAHSAHVVEGQFGAAFGCEVCHVKPVDMFSPGHIDSVDPGAVPMASLTFSGMAVNGSLAPTWNRSTATCSSTYCHGTTLPAGATPTVNNPRWTNPGDVYCGSCHGVPPLPPHIQVDTTTGFGVCNPCHSFTVDAAGKIIPASQGGKHINGNLEASGHDANWMDPTNAGFHAFAADKGIGNCTPCHGADLAGGSVNLGCTVCHKAGGPGNDFSTGCTGCHGGADNQTGAPPEAIWGYAGDPARGGGTLDPIRVGAHTKHLAPTLTSPFPCNSCHVVPTSLLSPGHIDNPTPVATVTFGGINANIPPGPAPTWTRSSATCASTYCHGNYTGVYAYETYNWGTDSYDTIYVNYAGKKASPVWTGAPMACDSCHGNPPSGTGTWHTQYHGYDSTYRQCELCHPDVASVNGVGVAITNPAQHVNGIVEVTPKWNTKCFGCH